MMNVKLIYNGQEILKSFPNRAGFRATQSPPHMPMPPPPAPQKGEKNQNNPHRT